MKFKKLNKDLKKRTYINKFEIKTYLQYKILYKFWFLKKNYQNTFFKIRQKLNYSYHYTHLTNICILTGNTRLISNEVKISKFKLKHLLNNGYIYNIKPSNW